MSSESMWALGNASAGAAQPSSSARRSNGPPGGHNPSSTSSRGSGNARGGRGKRGGSSGGVTGGGSGNGPSGRSSQAPAFHREVAPHLPSAQGGHGPASHPVTLPLSAPISNTSSHAHGNGHGHGRKGSTGGSDNGTPRAGTKKWAKEKEALWNSLWGDEADDDSSKKAEDEKVEEEAKNGTEESGADQSNGSGNEVPKGKTLLQRIDPLPAATFSSSESALPTSINTDKPSGIRSPSGPDKSDPPDLFAGRSGASASRWALNPGDAPVSLAPVRARGGGRGGRGGRGGATGSNANGLDADMGKMSLRNGQADPGARPSPSSSTDRALPPHLTEPNPRTLEAATAPPSIAETVTLTHDPVSSPPELKTILSGQITTFIPPEPLSSSSSTSAFVPAATTEPPVTPHKAIPLDRIDPSTLTTPNGSGVDWADDDDDEAALAAELEEMKAQWGMSEHGEQTQAGAVQAGESGSQDEEDFETASAPPLDTPGQSPPRSPQAEQAGLQAIVSAKLPANLAQRATGLTQQLVKGSPGWKGGLPTGRRNGWGAADSNDTRPAELVATSSAQSSNVAKAVETSAPPPRPHPSQASSPLNTPPLTRQPAKERPKTNIKNDAFLRMSGGMFGGGRGGGSPRRGRGRGASVAGNAGQVQAVEGS